MDIISGGLSGRGLLGADGAESNENFVAERASIPQYGDNNTMDMFDPVRVKWRARIGRSRLLVIGAVGDGGMLVWG